jgi:tRNA pseudouridine55 synthase
VTSFSMVSLVRRLTGVRRVGHAGTLDPLASGVLPVAIGQATRLIEYMDDALKTYHAAVRFGEATDTYDAAGKVTARGDASGVTGPTVEAALGGFTGEIEQTPPMFSAIKVAGKALYQYAREGADVSVASRRVYVERATLRRFAGGVAEIEVRCGKGTYIRSIAHDVGQRLGCGAHLTALRRTSSGGFGLDEAQAPHELAALAGGGRLDEALLAPDRAVERRPVAIFGEQRSADVVSGRDVAIAASGPADLCRVYSVEGEFLGVLRHRGAGVWHPEKVLARG